MRAIHGALYGEALLERLSAAAVVGSPEVQGLDVGLMMLLLRMLFTVVMIMMRLLNTNTNDDHNDGQVRRFIRRGGEVYFPALEDSFRIWGLGLGIQCSGSSYYEILCSDALEKQETLYYGHGYLLAPPCFSSLFRQ